MPLDIAKEYLIFQGILIFVYLVYAALLFQQSRFFWGPNVVEIHLIPQLNKTILSCATVLLVLQLALLVDPFGVLPIYPELTFLFVHAVQFGICGLAASSYVYHSVKSFFKITFEKPVAFWRKLIVYESLIAFFAYIVLTIIAVDSDNVLYLAMLGLFICAHITFHFLISAICQIRVMMFFDRFMNTATHNPQFLARSRNIVRNKLLMFCLVYLIVICSSTFYTVHYWMNPDLQLLVLRDPHQFQFLRTGIVEISNLFVFCIVLGMGWLPKDYKGGLSELHPATPVLFPVRASTATSRKAKRRSDQESEMTPRNSALISGENSLSAEARKHSGYMKSDAISCLDSEHTIFSFGSPFAEKVYRKSGPEETEGKVDESEGKPRQPSTDGCSEILSETQFMQIWRSISGTLLHGKCVCLFSLHHPEVRLQTFFDKTINEGPTVLIIRTSKNEIIGGFSSHSWQQNNVHYGAGETFLFAFQPHFVKYTWSEDNEFFMLTIKDAWPAALDAYIVMDDSSDSTDISTGNTVHPTSTTKITGNFSYSTSGPGMKAHTSTPALLGEDTQEFAIVQFEIWGFQSYPPPRDFSSESTVSYRDSLPRSPNIGSSNISSPNMVSPNMVSPPNVGSSNIGSPNRGSPPNVGSPNICSPDFGAPQTGSPQHRHSSTHLRTSSVQL